MTKIEKKYKDKRTGEMKSIEISYSKVKDRLKEFREANPHGSIVTNHTVLTDRITFRAHIVKDKGDAASAEATGHATGKDDGSEKVFEKLETIAVGRALALLGYASDGEIASSEEMEDFEAYQKQQRESMLLAYTERLGDASTLDELKEVWATVEGSYRVELEPLKNELKKKLDEKTQSPTKKRGVATVSEG